MEEKVDVLEAAMLLCNFLPAHQTSASLILTVDTASQMCVYYFATLGEAAVRSRSRCRGRTFVHRAVDAPSQLALPSILTVTFDFPLLHEANNEADQGRPCPSPNLTGGHRADAG